MATYSQQCYQVGSFGYASNFTLYVELSEKWIDQNNNSSYVDYNVYCQSSGSGSINANHFKYFQIESNEIVNVTENVSASSPYAWIPIANGSIGPIYHDVNGNKSVYFYAEIKASSYGVGASIEGWFDLANIPRYAYFSKYELAGTGLNNIDVRYRPDRWISAAQYSLNGQVWTNLTVISGSWNSPDNDVVYRISNVNPNTDYNIRTRIQYANNLWTETGLLYAKTKDIGKISSAPNINFGDLIRITKTNPSGNQNNIKIQTLNPTTTIKTITQTTDDMTITLTQEEWDALYKKLGNSNLMTIRYLVETIGTSTYSNYVDKTLTLIGNYKTIRINKNDNWKRGQVYVKRNGAWKKGVIWINDDDVWKRGI